jgi:hypothetical protein
MRYVVITTAGLGFRAPTHRTTYAATPRGVKTDATPIFGATRGATKLIWE